MYDADVIISGCGPTGAILAAYLGRMGVRCLVVEREKEVITDPRGIVLDEDGIRILQGVGVYDEIFTKIGSAMSKFQFISGVHQNLMKPPFLEMDYSTTEGGTGHPGFMCHKQPMLETVIRQAISSLDTVDLKLGCVVKDIVEEGDCVKVEYGDEGGGSHTLRAKFLVACDGKTGVTRKMYMEPRGIVMENTATCYQETWVALNWKIHLPTPETHPDFPLWKLGFGPKDVYDLFFPKEFRFLCSPKRPAVCGRFGLPEERLWRFEFVVSNGEDGHEMSKWKKIREVVLPYLTHPGQRYGLNHPISFPEDCIEVLRCRPFKFAARCCNKWALGRVILTGDAAHVFPPFGGQGIASGFRDASALAWRLAVASKPGFKDYESLFRAWYIERKQQLELSLNATVDNGNYVTQASKLKSMALDWGYWAIQLIPSVRRYLEKGQRRHGMTRYIYHDGLSFIPGPGSGIFLPQVYARRLDGTDGVLFTDDTIFSQHKKKLFQIVVLLDDPLEVADASKELESIDSFSKGELSAAETTFVVHNLTVQNSSDYSPNVLRIASDQEFAKSPLCNRRPEPKYYNPYRMKEEVSGQRFLIVRPDRLVYAACKTGSELNIATKQLAQFLKS
jgi:2-polyprenyl-6-methoxyphenol hydroxylase-like FAD-dependent oxidoreductase